MTARRRWGDLLRAARLRKGLSIRQLSERLAESAPLTPQWFAEVETLRRNIRRWENGKNTPRAAMVLRLAGLLDVSVGYFNGADNDPTPAYVSAVELADMLRDLASKIDGARANAAADEAGAL
jgi:transcriptional regulator with XRE-family HTH domain